MERITLTHTDIVSTDRPTGALTGLVSHIAAKEWYKRQVCIRLLVLGDSLLGEAVMPRASV